MVDTVDTDLEAATEVADITPIRKIKIKVYALHLEITYSTTVRKLHQTRCG